MNNIIQSIFFFFIGELIALIISQKIPEKKKLPFFIIGTVLSGALAFGVQKNDYFFTPSTAVDSTPVFTAVVVSSTPASTVEPVPTAFTDNEFLGMVLVPAGEFIMGGSADNALAECQKYNSDCQRDWFTNEEPEHKIYLDAYYIDKYEVTNALYKACVEAGACEAPKKMNSYAHTSYYDNPEFDDYPVVYIDWDMAQTYCNWMDRQLPTEAQWEKAARGVDARTYPWGEGIEKSYANFYSYVGDATVVGSYENGKSVYGVYDMAGNVWEWVEDWHSEIYYNNSPLENPLGPASGEHRVIRGGSWDLNGDGVRSSLRRTFDPSNFVYDLGFRCAKDANP